MSGGNVNVSDLPERAIASEALRIFDPRPKGPEEVISGFREAERKEEFLKDWEASWEDLQSKVIKRKESIERILAEPTEEEKKRWERMTDEEIRADINEYLDKKAAAYIRRMKLVASVDQGAFVTHIDSSSKLERWRRKPAEKRKGWA